MKLSNKAQTSIEMLFFVGAAIVLATILGLVLKNLFNATEPEVTQRIEDTTQQVGNS